MKRFGYSLVLLLWVLPMIFAGVTPVHAQSTASPVPMLAYYYIWFDPGSWDRAKTDTPLLGKYSSDDAAVMLQHIRWAKAAGITGFIVSWKSTDVLNRRLEQLAKLAEQENFKLAVIYQGLDFDRNPLPVDRISSDLSYFADHFASMPVFDLYSKPLVIWSGTWQFSVKEIAGVTQPLRDRLLILASERNLNRYSELIPYIDGDAYYWSSVNPDTYTGYADKLAKMGAAVHAAKGLWIAPAAPGFDARLVGGTSTVDRNSGDTFRTQINTALASAPDALGIISWNEFSENSHIEPSVNFGSTYLDVLSQINQLPAPTIGEFDSSEQAAVIPTNIFQSRTAALAAVGILFVGSVVLILFRRKRN